MSAFEGVEFNFVNARLDGWSGGIEIFLANKTANGIAVVNAFHSKETARRLLD